MPTCRLCSDKPAAMSHPTPRLVFPDTTVLINFGLIDEMALLGRLVEG